MIYRVLIGYDTGGVPIYKWNCDCEICLTTAGECRKVRMAGMANTDEDKEERRREYFPFLEP